MKLSNSPKVQWGKLTSLNPNFDNITLSKNPSNLIFASPFQENIDKNQYECRIYQHKQECFILYIGNCLVIQVDNKTVNEGEAFKINSGEKINIILKKKGGEVPMEFIFSAELKQAQKNALKRDGERNEDIVVAEIQKKMKEDFKNDAKCVICHRMICECVSAVPCLHNFCMICFMRHLKRSQECPECEEKFVEFRKNVFWNNLIEGFEESWGRIDRSLEEYRKMKRELQTKKIFSRFEYANEDVYEGKWKKCRRHGTGKMEYRNGDVYEGDWRNGYMEGKGKLMYRNGGVYEGNWRKDKKEGKGKMMFSHLDIYEGDWKNDKMHGKGKYIGNNGNVYQGDLKGDMIEGKGRMRYSNGDVYEGYFKNDRREGKGRMKYRDGRVCEGKWENDEREEGEALIYVNGEEEAWKKRKKNLYQKNFKNKKRKWQKKNGMKENGNRKRPFFVKGLLKIRREDGETKYIKV